MGFRRGKLPLQILDEGGDVKVLQIGELGDAVPPTLSIGRYNSNPVTIAIQSTP